MVSIEESGRDMCMEREGRGEGEKAMANKGLQFHAHLAIVVSGLIFPH